MTGAVDWSNLTVAGAFVVGAILATVATLRLLRSVLGIVERDPELHRRDRGDTPPE